LKLISYCPEGARHDSIVNWHTSPSSRIVVNIRLWSFYVYFRVRSPLVGGKRVLFSIERGDE